MALFVSMRIIYIENPKESIVKFSNSLDLKKYKIWFCNYKQNATEKNDVQRHRKYEIPRINPIKTIEKSRSWKVHEMESQIL